MWLSVMDTKPAPPIRDHRPPALENCVSFVNRLAAPGLEKPRHHQRRALASFLAMHQQAMPQRELFVDQRRRLVQRHYSLRKERHVNRLRRSPSGKSGSTLIIVPSNFCAFLQIADEPTPKLSRSPANSPHSIAQLDGPTDICVNLAK